MNEVIAAKGIERAVSNATFEIYKDAAKEWRWRLRAANGRIVADSGEGYKRLDECSHSASQIKTHVATAKTVKLKAKK